MKKYIKPILEVKEFKAVEKIAALNDFLEGGDAVDAGLDLGTENITSYYATSV